MTAKRTSRPTNVGTIICQGLKVEGGAVSTATTDSSKRGAATGAAFVSLGLTTVPSSISVLPVERAASFSPAVTMIRLVERLGTSGTVSAAAAAINDDSPSAA